MNQHRWQRWLGLDSPDAVELLQRAKEDLKKTWEWDQKTPKSYPLNTSYALAEFWESLSKRHREKKTKVVHISKPKEPNSLSKLIPERRVKSIWEAYHSGTFRDAINQAAGFGLAGENRGWKVFNGILRSIEIAYLVGRYGDELLPRPKVNILHRGLDQIAKAAGLGAQTDSGFAEFLDDLCPCGLKSHKEAVRKLRSRSARIRQPSSSGLGGRDSKPNPRGKKVSG